MNTKSIQMAWLSDSWNRVQRKQHSKPNQKSRQSGEINSVKQN